MGKKNEKMVRGTVGVPKEYFLRMAKHDYNAFSHALAREFYQNSSDADATLISVTYDRSERTITIMDDGIGMNMDTLRNKLLVLGGSKKRDGNTGAFGKAKELLFFSWDNYSIHTRDLIVEGSGAEYTIKRGTHYDGTICTIKVPVSEDFSSITRSFGTVAERFEIDAEIEVNGNRVHCDMKRGQLMRTSNWGSIYVDVKKVDEYYAHCRINGQWMFSKYLGRKVGEVIIELKRGSTEMLTSNRDGIKSKYSEEFDSLLKELVTEREKFLRPEPKIVQKVIRGSGLIKVNWHKAIDATRELFRKISEHGASKVLALARGLTDEKNPDDVVKLQLEAALKKAMDESSITFIGYEPNFILSYEDSQEAKVERFMSTRKARVLADAWTNIIKQVLIDIGWYGEIVCGFDFTSHAKASFSTTDNVPCFSLNPQLVCNDTPEIKQPLRNKKYLRNDLLMSATHEVTHLNETYHDGDFVLRFHWVTAQTWKSEKIYTKILSRATDRN